MPEVNLDPLHIQGPNLLLDSSEKISIYDRLLASRQIAVVLPVVYVGCHAFHDIIGVRFDDHPAQPGKRIGTFVRQSAEDRVAGLDDARELQCSDSGIQLSSPTDLPRTRKKE